MLDGTIVHRGGEMGRLPVIQFREGLRHNDMRFRVGPREIRLVEHDEARVVQELLA
ncbi:MAG: hypothetical protein ABGZ35_21480 [Planctomycetaceae bacterium]